MAFIFSSPALRSLTTHPSTSLRTCRPLCPSLPYARSRIHRPATCTAGLNTPPVDFSLPITDGSTLTLQSLSQNYSTVVLYFYPRDATPGCTVEASDFRDLLPEFEAVGATVVGVSRDSVDSHRAFAEELGLNFALVADDGTLSEGYGVWKMMKRGEREFMAIERSTFVIRGGSVVREWRGIKSAGHADEVLKAVKEMS